MTFGEKIKKMRQIRNLNQRQLAEKLNITTRTIRGWELDGRIPQQLWVYEALAAALDCPIEYLTESDSAALTDFSTNTPHSVTIDPSQFLSAAQTLFYQHHLPEQEQLELMLELERLLFSTCQ